MTKVLVLLIGLTLGGISHAQIKCWTTAEGKRACGDVPPPGAKVATVKVSTSTADATPSAASKESKQGPLTAAEREQEYRKRQADAQKADAKAAQQKRDDDAKKENCERTQEMLRSLESGQRIQRADAKGERYYLDDAAREQETAKTRTQIQQNCG